MVDVAVDQKPLSKLPYDTDDIPDAVKQRVAAVEALYTPSNGQPAASFAGAEGRTSRTLPSHGCYPIGVCGPAR
jgi:hypothetical protein